VQKAVTSVLERLNARYRRAIELRFVEELPREECALALEVKIGTFDVLLLRALKAFRKEWTEVVGEKEVESEA
jgi:RNA polymerase sigma-70 factor (ECF subfamily)